MGRRPAGVRRCRRLVRRDDGVGRGPLGRAGLGEWDVRALVGHTSRALLTVETYLAAPAETAEIDSAVGYFRATSAMAAGPAVAQRGRDAGTALGADPAAAVAEIAARVVPLVDACDGTELLTTIVGGMRLADYLPTRTFELAVHTSDLAAALGLPLDVAAGRRRAGAGADHRAGRRPGSSPGRCCAPPPGGPRLPPRFSVL